MRLRTEQKTFSRAEPSRKGVREKVAIVVSRSELRDAQEADLQLRYHPCGRRNNELLYPDQNPSRPVTLSLNPLRPSNNVRYYPDHP
jgi:hypothetical protein